MATPEINIEDFQRGTATGASPVRKHISFDRDGKSEADKEGYKLVEKLQNKQIDIKKLVYVLLKNAVAKMESKKG